MIFKPNYEKVVIHILKKISAGVYINKDTLIGKELYIDSMGWIQFLIQIEKKLNHHFAPDFLAKQNYETVGELIRGIQAHCEK